MNIRISAPSSSNISPKVTRVCSFLRVDEGRWQHHLPVVLHQSGPHQPSLLSHLGVLAGHLKLLVHQAILNNAIGIRVCLGKEFQEEKGHQYALLDIGQLYVYIFVGEGGGEWTNKWQVFPINKIFFAAGCFFCHFWTDALHGFFFNIIRYKFNPQNSSFSH